MVSPQPPSTDWCSYKIFSLILMNISTGPHLNAILLNSLFIIMILVKGQMAFFLFRCSNLASITSLVTRKSQATRMEGTSMRITTSSMSRTLASTTVSLTCTSTQGAEWKLCRFKNLLQEQQHQVRDQTEPVLSQRGEHDIYGELICQHFHLYPKILLLFTVSLSVKIFICTRSYSNVISLGGKRTNRRRYSVPFQTVIALVLVGS